MSEVICPYCDHTVNVDEDDRLEGYAACEYCCSLVKL